VVVRSLSIIRGAPFIFVFPCKLCPRKRLQGGAPLGRNFMCGIGDRERRRKMKPMTNTMPRTSRALAIIDMNGKGNPPPV